MAEQPDIKIYTAYFNPTQQHQDRNLDLAFTLTEEKDQSTI